MLLYQLKGIWKKYYMNQHDRGWNIFGVKEQCFSIVIFAHDPMGFGALRIQTMKEGPLLHIAKCHVQQCLQVSQHYKQLCRNNTPRSTSGTRGRCRQFCIQLLILIHSDIKSKNVVTHLSSKSAIRKMLCAHDQCISDIEKFMNWFRRQGEDVNFLASYIRPWSGGKKTQSNKSNKA